MGVKTSHLIKKGGESEAAQWAATTGLRLSVFSIPWLSAIT